MRPRKQDTNQLNRQAAIYIRVSTDKQVKSGLGLDDQKGKTLAEAQRLGLVIQPDYIFVDEGLSGKKAENALVKADITLNKNMVPFDDKSPFVTSGIRVGVSAITTRGLKESDMAQIATWLDRVLMAADDETVIATVRGEVNESMKAYPLYPEW